MDLQPIGPETIDKAEWLLRRGFPDRGPGFWQQALGRLEAFRERALTGPIGVLLALKGEPVGVLLTLWSRSDGTPAGTKINLSSWYVEDRARYLAPRMLQRVTAAEGVLYTDLTPSPSVRALNERLGLLPVRIGSMIVPVALDALRRDEARVIDHTGYGMLASTEAAMLADHAKLGAAPALLESADGAAPLIFAPSRLRGLNGMRLLFAPSRALVARHRGAIARYLMRRGAWFLEIEANADERWPGTLFARHRAAMFAKGLPDDDAIDHSYSELVFIPSA